MIGVPVLIVSNSCLLKDGLKIMMTAFSDIEVVSLKISDYDAVGQILDNKTPVIALVDTSLNNFAAIRILRLIKESKKKILCVAMTDGERDSRLSLESGADHILHYGFSAADLFQAVNQTILAHEL